MRILLLLTVSLFVSSCVKDLSHQSPYSMAIGKSFILQQDLYIYNNIGYSDLNIGLPRIIPQEVDEKYIGYKDNQIIIKGVALKNSTVKISNIISEVTGQGDYVSYIALINGNTPNVTIAMEILNFQKNPPITLEGRNKDAPPVPIWSDPPIFKAEYALPLPSDGIWWK